jgi:phage host-nuclease inhibitor protein Gam
MAVDVDRIESTLYVPIQKSEELPDGSVMVYGLASGPELDIDGQRMDPEWLQRAMPEWMLWGNIREMHQSKAVGKAKQYEWTPDGAYIAAKIIDEEACRKIKEGVYNGFSIGVKNAKLVPDPEAPKGRIVDGKIIEVSVVDYPAYPKAKFDLVKAAESGGWQDMQTGAIVEKEVIEPDVEKATETPKKKTRKKNAKEVKKGADVSPEAEAQDAASMADIIQQIQSIIPQVQDLLQREQSEVDAGNADDKQDVAGLKETLDNLTSAVQSLVSVLNHEKTEAGEQKTITTASGLSPYNLDGRPKKTDKAADSVDIQKVGRKMAKKRLDKLINIANQFKDVVAALEELARELGDSSFEGGDSNNPKNPGGKPMQQTEHKPPQNKGDNLGALKGAGCMKDGDITEDADIAETAKDADVMEDADLAEAARLLRTLKDALLGRKDADIAEDADISDAAKDADIAEDADLAEAARLLRTLKDALVGRKDADIADSARVRKDMDVSEMAKSIGEAVAQSLAKAGIIQPKPENELLAKFSELGRG